MRCIAGRRLILSGTTAVFIVICSPPIFAQVPLWKVTKAGHEVVIEGYARTNGKCEPIDGGPGLYGFARSNKEI
jgi:hypothetical protein